MIDTGSKIYTVRKWQEDGWWMVYVKELDCLTQAESADQVPEMAVGLIAAQLDIPEEQVTIAIQEGQEL